MTDLLEVESRKRIFLYIQEHAGSHLREVGRRCGLSLGSALYHLDRLESARLVAVRHDGRYKRYFPVGLGSREELLVAAVHHTVPRRIVNLLLDQGTATQREFAKHIGVARSTISSNVQALTAAEIIRRERRDRENHYTLVDPGELTLVLAKHAHIGRTPSPVGLALPHAVTVTAPAKAGGD